MNPLTLLGGRLQLHPRGPRPTEDPLWLAATVPALPNGAHVLDAGCGIGTAGLALLLRQPTLALTSLDVNPELPPLAAQNATLNGLVLTPVIHNILTFRAEPFAAVLCNPPFHAQERGHASATRGLAHTMPAGMFTPWLAALHRLTAPGGTLHLILHSLYRNELTAFTEANRCHLTLAPIQSSSRPPKRLLALARTNTAPGLTLAEPVTTREPLEKPLYLSLT